MSRSSDSRLDHATDNAGTILPLCGASMSAARPVISTILVQVYVGRGWPKRLARDAAVSERAARLYRSGEMEMGVEKVWSLAKRNGAFRALLIHALKSLDAEHPAAADGHRRRVHDAAMALVPA